MAVSPNTTHHQTVVYQRVGLGLRTALVDLEMGIYYLCSKHPIWGQRPGRFVVEEGDLRAMGS